MHSMRLRGLTGMLVFAFALAAGLTGCSSDTGQRVRAGGISVEVPGSLAAVTTAAVLHGGWETALADDPEAPELLVRLSDDLGRAPLADATFSTLRGEALFQQGYGPDFTIVNRADIDVTGADRAMEAQFTYTSDGKTVTGYWWLMSSAPAGTTSAVEISGDGVTAQQAEALRASLDYSPQS